MGIVENMPRIPRPTHLAPAASQLASFPIPPSQLPRYLLRLAGWLAAELAHAASQPALGHVDQDPECEILLT
jgi:hypothetical protein